MQFIVCLFLLLLCACHDLSNDCQCMNTIILIRCTCQECMNLFVQHNCILAVKDPFNVKLVVQPFLLYSSQIV